MIVEIVYIPHGQKPMHQTLPFEPGLTVAEVLAQSELVKHYPEVKTLPIGIFGEIVSLETRVKPGDRIEIYRPLLLDPKEKRRQRAKM